jgi:nucleoside-diphosphate-sugar epimerase
MKFFITGTTGFIGGTLKEHYLAQGHDVTEYVRGEDISDALDIAQPDVIVNCAGEIYNPELMYATNVNLVYTILEWLKNHHRVRLIHIGSSSEYGVMDRAARETDAINPVDVYQATKGSATLMCRGYARQFGLQTCVARIYSGYGIKERPHRLFPRLYRAFFENQAMTLFDGYHDFIYIDDFVRGLDLLLASEWPAGEIVNFGSGVQHSNREVLEAWRRVTGKKAPVTYQDTLNKPYESKIWLCDTKYATMQYGFKTEYSLEQGIEEFIRKMK